MFWPYLGILGLVAAAFFLLFGARASQSRKDLNDSVTALQGRLLADQDEIRTLQETVATTKALNESLGTQVSDLRGSIQTLERIVTGVDIITAGFIALGVDPKLLAAAGNGKP